MLVDTSDGKPFDLVTLPVSQMGMAIAPLINHSRYCASSRWSFRLRQAADTLAALPALPSLTGLTQRQLQLSMDPMLDRMGMQALMESMATGDGRNGSRHDGAWRHERHGEYASRRHEHEPRIRHGAWHVVRRGFDFHNANRINGKAFDMNEPMFAAARGQYERWVISGKGDMMLHPFHIHGTQFRILSENGKPPAAHRRGWKTPFVWKGT